LIGPLFIHADADIARPFPRLRALFNRVVRNALYIAGMIVEGVFGLWRRWRRRRSGCRVIRYGNLNVGNVVGRTFGLLAIEVPVSADIPPPAEPTVALGLMPAAIPPSELTTIDWPDSLRAHRDRRLPSSSLQSWWTTLPLCEGGKWGCN
jgi:hypothetical protein